MSDQPPLRFIISLGRRRRKGYISDLAMTVQTPDGPRVNELPSKIAKYLPYEVCDTRRTGDNKTFELPAGNYPDITWYRDRLQETPSVEISYLNTGQDRLQVEVVDQ